MELFWNEFQDLVCSFNAKNLRCSHIFPYFRNWLNQSSVRGGLSKSLESGNKKQRYKKKNKSASISCIAPYVKR